MSIATTAELIVRIIGQDLLSPATASAERGLSSMSGMSLTSAKSASTAEKALGLVGSAATGMGNALNHAKGFLGSLISGPLGMIGLGAAAFTLGGALKSGIDEANALASTLEKLTAITGDSATSLSALIAVGNKYGIDQQTIITSAAFAEKTIGKLADTMSGKGKDAVSKLTALDKQYGIVLVDNKGKAVDYETELSRVADYYTSNASASSKAALAAQLLGRGYQSMIPLLQQGSAGIAAAEATAASLGETLNTTDVAALMKYQAAMRDAGAAVDGLKLQLAVDLIPDLTKLADTVTKFVTDHRTDIQAFFEGAIKAGEELGGALVTVGTDIVGVWNKIPGPMRDLMIQALIGNKVIKTVFGINIIGSVEGAIGTIGQKLVGSLFSNLFSKQIATPLVTVAADVVNVGGAKIPGLPNGVQPGPVEDVAGTAERLSLTSVLGAFSVAAVPLIASQIVLALNSPQQIAATDLAARQATATARGIPLSQVPATGGRASLGGPSSSALPPGTSFQDYGAATQRDTLNSIKEGNANTEAKWQTAINIWDAVLADQKRATEHAASEASIKEIAGTNHEFLTLFRTGAAKALIGLFPAEKNYLATASDATKGTAQYTRGLKEDITALQRAEVGATAAQKAKLSADITVLEGLVQATTAAVNGVRNSIGGLLYNPNQNSRPNKDDKIIIHNPVRDVNKQTALKKRYGNDATGGGA